MIVWLEGLAWRTLWRRWRTRIEYPPAELRVSVRDIGRGIDSEELQRGWLAFDP